MQLRSQRQLSARFPQGKAKVNYNQIPKVDRWNANGTGRQKESLLVSKSADPCATTAIDAGYTIENVDLHNQKIVLKKRG